jgi:1-acyl-sn-glycerol-3-phosphate acyltransferase
MITAETKKWARLIFNPYEEKLLRKNFSAFYLAGIIPELTPGNALLITPNHFSWWDGFFIDFAARKLFKKNFHILMLEEQLKKYSFFRKVGAFSVEPGSYKGIKESLSYSAGILKNPDNLLVYYPQGKIEPYDTEQITIKKGTFNIIRGNNNVDIIPAGFRIEYDNIKKPAVYLRFGEVLKDQMTNEDQAIYKIIFENNLRQLNVMVRNKDYTLDLFREHR